MHKIGWAYVTLNNIGVYHSGTPSGWSVSGSNYLVGDFTQSGTGNHYIMLVNKSLSSSASYSVSSSYGQVYYVSPSDGDMHTLSGTLTLSAGEGRLLTAQ